MRIVQLMQIAKGKFVVYLKIDARLFSYVKRETAPRDSQLLANPAERLCGAGLRSDVLLARTLENVFILEPTRALPSHERKVARIVEWGSEWRERQQRRIVNGRKRVPFTWKLSFDNISRVPAYRVNST